MNKQKNRNLKKIGNLGSNSAQLGLTGSLMMFNVMMSRILHILKYPVQKNGKEANLEKSET